MSQSIAKDGKGTPHSSTGVALNIPVEVCGAILDEETKRFLVEWFNGDDESTAVHQDIITSIAEKKTEESSGFSGAAASTISVVTTGQERFDDSSVFFSAIPVIILEDSSNPSFPNNRLNNEAEGLSRREYKELTVQYQSSTHGSSNMCTPLSLQVANAAEGDNDVHQAKKKKRRPLFFCEYCLQPELIKVEGENKKQKHICPGRPVRGFYPSPYECGQCKNPTTTYEVWVTRSGEGKRSKPIPHSCSKKY